MSPDKNKNHERLLDRFRDFFGIEVRRVPERWLRVAASTLMLAAGTAHANAGEPEQLDPSDRGSVHIDKSPLSRRDLRYPDGRNDVRIDNSSLSAPVMHYRGDRDDVHIDESPISLPDFRYRGGRNDIRIDKFPAWSRYGSRYRNQSNLYGVLDMLFQINEANNYKEDIEARHHIEDLLAKEGELIGALSSGGSIDTEDTNKYLGANLNVTQLTESDMILLIAKIQRITDREVNAVIRDMEKTQLERERRMIFINGILNVSDGMLQRHGANRFNSGYRGRSSRGNVRIAR